MENLSWNTRPTRADGDRPGTAYVQDRSGGASQVLAKPYPNLTGAAR